MQKSLSFNWTEIYYCGWKQFCSQTYLRTINHFFELHFRIVYAQLTILFVLHVIVFISYGDVNIFYPLVRTRFDVVCSSALKKKNFANHFEFEILKNDMYCTEKDCSFFLERLKERIERKEPILALKLFGTIWKLFLR